MNTLDDQLEIRIRLALQTVAGTINPDDAPGPAGRSPRRWRRLAIAGGVAIGVPTALAAGAILRSGPEYVDTIPESTIVVRGEVGGSEYLLVESRRTDCGKPIGGVELIETRDNLLGSEWSTTGHQYGVPVPDCGQYDPTPWLKNPALHDSSGSEVGDSFVWVWSVHPKVTAVRITTDTGVRHLPVHAVDGAGYAVFEIPRGLDEYRAELMIGDEVVPGSVEEKVVPVP